jgi:transposase
MRGNEEQQERMFSYISAERRVPEDHPLRAVRRFCDGALAKLSPRFEELYSHTGRPSIAPEMLLRALVLQALYSVRSERLLMEQLDYNLLFRWFVGLRMDDAVWDVTVFTKNRQRLMAGEVAQLFLAAVVEQARAGELLSDEHFTVDGTLIEAWASRRSYEPRPDPPARGTGTRGRKLLRDTHQSRTDPEANLYKRRAGAEARPSYLGHVLMENRSGLVVEACVTRSSTRAEREAALTMVTRVSGGGRKLTLGADKAYQEEQFIAALRQRGVVPHVAEYAPSPRWKNWLRPQERNGPEYAVSQRQRKRVEKIFAWIKSVAGLRKTKLRGRGRVDWLFRITAAAFNLVRMRGLLPGTA